MRMENNGMMVAKN